MAARSRSLLSLLPVLLLASVSGNRCELSTAPGTGELRITGTIHFLGVEGGCWQLEATDGRRFELRQSRPSGAPFRDGARATLLGIPRHDVVSSCQVGTVFEVESWSAVG